VQRKSNDAKRTTLTHNGNNIASESQLNRIITHPKTHNAKMITMRGATKKSMTPSHMKPIKAHSNTQQQRRNAIQQALEITHTTRDTLRIQQQKGITMPKTNIPLNTFNRMLDTAKVIFNTRSNTIHSIYIVGGTHEWCFRCP